MVGESTKGRSFLVVKESMSKYLASAGFCLILCRSTETLQYGPNSDQNYKTLYLMILCKDFFKFKHLSTMRHNKLTEVTIVNFPPKKCLWPISPKNYAALYFLIHFNDF